MNKKLSREEDEAWELFCIRLMLKIITQKARIETLEKKLGISQHE